jgi:hypothetical protein
VTLSKIGKQVWVKFDNDDDNKQHDKQHVGGEFRQGEIIKVEIRKHDHDDSSIVIEHLMELSDNGKQQHVWLNLIKMQEVGRLQWEKPIIHNNSATIETMSTVPIQVKSWSCAAPSPSSHIKVEESSCSSSSTSSAANLSKLIKVESCASSSSSNIKVEKSWSSSSSSTLSANLSKPVKVESCASSSNNMKVESSVSSSNINVEPCSASSANHDNKQDGRRQKRNKDDADNNARKKKARVAIKAEEEATKEEEDELSKQGQNGDETIYDVEEKTWFKPLKTKEKEKIKKNWLKAKKWIDNLGLANGHRTARKGLDRIITNNKKKKYVAPASFEQVLWLANFLFPEQDYYYRLFYSTFRPGIAVRQALRKRKEKDANDPLVSWHKSRQEWLPPTATVLVGIVNVILEL